MDIFHWLLYSQLGRSELHISEHAVLLERLKERTISGRTHWRLNLQNMEPVPGMVFSPPFYTSCPGYMVCVYIYMVSYFFHLGCEDYLNSLMLGDLTFSV